ncbi:LamG-like jellyroll fold domain-containing protein [Winogradskyella bathintestinalis]|uniref:T9SS type A sorting domain-containing protein n=1 Tax=Winogradskyella bathintestinalis TaxID=3035208 RepID=A0ABT7ZRC6_9FLAO|nr:LamG-like jellyroll fold domain-containing protein [Winogradskyella bathintestinalis]MDN3491542.1 T9SS type A sorting domain-containing protein [Winogradskyella bathintestinalis]
MKQIYLLTSFLFFTIFNLSSQTLDVNFTGNCGSYIGIADDSELSQSFTSGLNGNLTKVGVGISIDACTETSIVNGTAKIYQGTCAGQLLTTQSFSFATGSSLSIKEIIFTTPAIVTSGEVYTLELSVNPNQPCTIDPFMPDEDRSVFIRWHLENEANCGGTYSGGTAYDPGCVIYPGDFYLQTYVAPNLSGNNALNFDGNDDYVELGNNAIFDITSQITLEASVYSTQLTGENNIITKFGDSVYRDSYLLRTINGVVYFDLKINDTWVSVNSISAIPLNTWSHISAVYNGTSMKLYINGVPNTTVPQTGNIDVSTSTVKIGKWNGSNSFNGNIDEVRIWNIAISDSDILDNYNTELTGNEIGLVAYYNFNQGTANGDNTSLTTLMDLSANNLIGTLNNFQLTGMTSNWVGGVDFSTLSLEDNFSLNRSEISLFPIPAHEFIQVSGLSKTENYRIYNIQGTKIKNGFISKNDKIDIQNLTNGMYFLQINGQNTLKFIKK